MNQSAPMPSALAELATFTDFLLTEELARYLRCASQTIRKGYSTSGSYLGIRPVKLRNRLLWPIKEVARLLAGGVQ